MVMLVNCYGDLKSSHTSVEEAFVLLRNSGYKTTYKIETDQLHCLEIFDKSKSLLFRIKPLWVICVYIG